LARHVLSNIAVPDDKQHGNDGDRVEQERGRLEGLIERLKGAALGTGDISMLSQLNVALTELERLILLRQPHLAEIDLAIVRAKVLLNEVTGEE